MKRFVEGEDRTQGVLLPEFLDDYVTEDNPVRVVDVFIDELDLEALGFVVDRQRNCFASNYRAACARLLGQRPSPRRRLAGGLAERALRGCLPARRSKFRNIEFNGKIAYLQCNFEDLSSGRLLRRTAAWRLCQDSFNLVEEWDMVTPQMVLRGALARTGVRPFPLSLTYEVTWLCNLSCGYCDRHTPMRHELTREEIFGALDEFRMLGMLHTHLDGGDPLTHRHIDEIVDWLTQRGITVSLNSNGILVPKKLHTIRKLSVLKISLDGPPDSHDAMRGAGSFEKALAGATAARDAGVKVEFTCTVGQHNAHTIEPLIDIASAVSISVVFQPALNSLFLDVDRDGSSWQLDVESIRAAFARIERIKRRSNVVGNGWSSLRHFRRFPEDTPPPCSAGWVQATMDPEGVLFSCPQLNRSDRSNSVTRLGAATAFANLSRTGCGQCWCARLVEGNYAWGMRVDRMLPPFERLPLQSRGDA